ncbi:MAG: HlyD family secretion protein, partial [Rhodobacteraceae bacterium]|nr:HlyD family secretion protein [Paracoccaceae bacterium]
GAEQLTPAYDTDQKDEDMPSDTPAHDHAPLAPAAANRRKRLLIPAGAVVGALVLWAVFGGLLGGHASVSTDDAYVQADLSQIAARVSGYVGEIPVAANQHVAKGDVLVKIDDGDLKIALDVASAKLAALDSTLARIDAQVQAGVSSVEQAKAAVAVADANQKLAQVTAERTRDLLKRAVAPQSDLDSAEASLASALAQVTAAQAALAGASAQVDVLRAQRAEAEATRPQLALARDQAARDLDKATLRAPFDGTVANVAIEQGELVAAGVTLMSVVPDTGLYIEANLKETQVAHVRAGQTVKVEVDALSGQDIVGRVESVAPATGSVFALLPANNATGNFTKVVQRVPVRIALTEGIVGLRAGLSAVVTIDTTSGQ